MGVIVPRPPPPLIPPPPWNPPPPPPPLKPPPPPRGTPPPPPGRPPPPAPMRLAAPRLPNAVPPGPETNAAKCGIRRPDIRTRARRRPRRARTISRRPLLRLWSWSRAYWRSPLRRGFEGRLSRRAEARPERTVGPRLHQPPVGCLLDRDDFSANAGVASKARPVVTGIRPPRLQIIADVDVVADVDVAAAKTGSPGRQPG